MTPRLTRRRRASTVVLATALAVVVPIGLVPPSVAQAATVDGPSLTDDAIELVDSTEEIGPGISLRQVTSMTPAGWYEQQILSVDLAEPAVSGDLLSGTKVTDRAPVSEMVNSAGAVAGVNGDFFDINNSGAPHGTSVKDSELIASSGYDPRGSWQQIGVGADGIGRAVDATLQATATFGGAEHPVAALNSANMINGSPVDGIIAYTSRWGDYRTSIGVSGSTDIASVLVEDDTVVSVDASGAEGTTIGKNGFVLVGREAGAAAIRALQPGDAASLSYGLKDELAQQMKFVIGSNRELVRDGVARPDSELDNDEHPRTVIGFKNGGTTMLLVTNNGRQSPVDGMTMRELARFMVRLGAENAWNLDGGGSTTMVARELGADQATVRNKPSDGYERSDPNGVGVFVEPGSGKAERIVVTPDAGDARVFPGLRRELTAAAVDDNLTPVAVSAGAFRWNSNAGNISGGLLTAPAAPTAKPIRVRVGTGRVNAETTVRVLGDLDQLTLSSDRLSIADATADKAVDIAVTGQDTEGFAAPIDFRDIDFDYDDAIVRITPASNGFTVTPLAAGGTVLVARVGDHQVKLPITVGVQTLQLYAFDDAAAATGRWATNGTSTASVHDDPDGIRLEFGVARNKGITASGDPARWVEIPGQPLRVRVKVKSDVYIPAGLTYAGFWDAAGNSHGIYGTGLQASDDWQYVTFAIPATATFPVRFNSFQGINTAVDQQKAGRFVLGGIEADVPSAIDLPEQEPLAVDALVSPDGSEQKGADWSFATLSDVQFTASVPELAKVGVAALERIRAQQPDLVVLNGDITDRGLPEDIALARRTLEEGGCELIAVGAEPAPNSTPDHTSGTIPCYYVPGNHESYGLGNVQSTLDPWEAEFGRPYRTFDHKGTRFLLLNSALGSLRGSDWDQWPMIEEALTSAADDDEIGNVMVFAHHAADDPGDPDASQLGDRKELQLLRSRLTQFREESGKGAAYVGSHAQIVDVQRNEGAPYMVLPSSGKSPYGTPDRGGFTGWVQFDVDRNAKADGSWLSADVRAFAQEVVIDAPESLQVGASATVGGHIVQPSGVQAGNRVVPLAYPMSVHWSGDAGLAIGSGAKAIKKAKNTGKVAILDPVTRELTALRNGSVTLSVTNESMREYTGPDSLTPITASRTVQVVADAGDAARVSVAPQLFSTAGGQEGVDQQPITIANTGTRPLRIEKLAVGGDGASADAFSIVGAGTCASVIKPGANCEVAIRFTAPKTPQVVTATLSVQTDAPGGTVRVPLTGSVIDGPATADDAGADGPTVSTEDPAAKVASGDVESGGR